MYYQVHDGRICHNVYENNRGAEEVSRPPLLQGATVFENPHRGIKIQCYKNTQLIQKKAGKNRGTKTDETNGEKKYQNGRIKSKINQ